MYQGKQLMDWVMEGLEASGQRYIIANEPYAEFNVAVYPDILPGAGALSGLHSALYHAQNDWVAVAACDMPFLPQGYWDLLCSRAETGNHQIVAGVGPSGFPEPLAAIYHRSLLPVVARKIQDRQLRLQDVLTEARALQVPWQELKVKFGSNLFLNINTLQDLP